MTLPKHPILRWPPRDLRDWWWCLFERRGKHVTSSNLGKLRRAALPLLETSGFSIVGEWYSPQVFGDAVVFLDGPRTRIRLVTDRGQMRVDVGSASEPERWTPVWAGGQSARPEDMVAAVVADLAAIEQKYRVELPPARPPGSWRMVKGSPSKTE